MRMGLIWSDVVRSTSLGPAVFEVAPDHQARVRGWALARRLTHAAQQDVHFPFVEAWAVLDGGITAISGYGLTSLPHGMRVIGFGALRLMLADLRIAGPEEPFPGEVVVDPAELRRRHDATAPDSPDAVEQAELLAACQDAQMLRWVARTLFADTSRTPATDDPGPAGPTDTGPTDTGPTDTGPTDTGPAGTGPTDAAAAALTDTAPPTDTVLTDTAPAGMPPADSAPTGGGNATVPDAGSAPSEPESDHRGSRHSTPGMPSLRRRTHSRPAVG
jgi:hypothetical protein